MDSVPAKGPSLDHIWMQLGINPVEAKIIVIGVQTGNEEEARAVLKQKLGDKELEDVVYSAVFDLLSRDFPIQMRDWMTRSGVTRDEATQAIRQLGNDMKRIFREADSKRKRRRGKH